MFVVLGDKRLLPQRGEMWWCGVAELFGYTYDPSGVGAVVGQLLQTLNPSGVRNH
ncbi:MAG TPA: hypothetical protein VGV87_24170 [Blastocatellia bacterium]|jgi:hypothetical protein|nr:hypothetical protein [Blastocatellia bacterium]